MTNDAPPSVRDTLRLRLGGWFEAQATGYGIVAVVMVLALLAAAATVKLLATPVL